MPVIGPLITKRLNLNILPAIIYRPLTTGRKFITKSTPQENTAALSIGKRAYASASLAFIVFCIYKTISPSSPAERRLLNPRISNKFVFEPRWEEKYKHLRKATGGTVMGIGQNAAGQNGPGQNGPRQNVPGQDGPKCILGQNGPK